MPIKTISGDLVRAKTGIRILSAFIAAIIALSSGLVVYAQPADINVKIIDGLKSSSISTDSRDPAQIVREAGYVLDVNDRLDADRFSEKDGGTIIIRRARLIRINENGIISYILGYDNSLSDVDSISAEQAYDEVNSEKNDSIGSFINRANTVIISADGKTKKFAVTADTVGEALEKAGIKLGKCDVVSPRKDTALTGKTKIFVRRVSYKIRTQAETIPFETTVIADPSMPAGSTEIITKGESGRKIVFYIDKYVNGELAETKTGKETVLSKPVTQVTKSGTKSIDSLSGYDSNGLPISELEAPADFAVKANGEPAKYRYCINGKATAYTDDPITSTGIVPKPGYIAVDPKQIPYGTECYVVSADGKYVYGYCIAADTGGFVKMGNTTIDLYMNSESMCDEWGNRPVNIYIL
jgi:uncharacterized protein YabE (DUF348 family)/3D (Asp-Asp-Asp) domain-containing protein